MDSIYQNAQATIVALFGENDDSGLPGVSKTSRARQPRFRTRRGCFISSCPPIATLIENSKWGERGWTYQEARLSRRCLFFTEYQVYFVCRECTRSEAVPSTPQSSWISTLLNCRSLDADLLDPNRSSMLEGYCQDRFAFSRRQLSYESDILDAFQGILTRSPFYTLWGVPFRLRDTGMNANSGMALGLLWTRRPLYAKESHLESLDDRPLIRRLGFPTWSWTSVTGEISNQGSISRKCSLRAFFSGNGQIAINNDANLQFSTLSSNRWIPLNDFLPPHQSCTPEDPRLLGIQGDLVRVALTENNSRNWKSSYHVWGCDNLSFEFDVEFDWDWETAATKMQALDDGFAEDALILVDCHGSQRSKKRRFILMLLRWVGDDRAERRGLISLYRDEYDAEALSKIPRSRREFILQ